MNVEPFPVIGIGASAGGLKAIQHFFENIDAPANAAFVIIQHLSPNHQSLMGDLLFDHTHLNIAVIKHQQKITPNAIYLIPTNKTVIVEDGKFVLLERDNNDPLNHPIDIFYESLGKNYCDRAISIILTGTGSDGTKGIKVVKENEGLVMVQDPRNAEFDGMPNSAINSGLVDYVGSIDMITAKLSTIIRGGQLNISLESFDITEGYDQEKTIHAILDQMEAKRNIDFKVYKKALLLRKIVARIQDLGLESINDYHDYLIGEPKEAEILESGILVKDSKFFRDKAAYQYLSDEILGSIFKQKNYADKVRIWSVGCSTGEEAYSLAITINEFIEAKGINHSFKIFATDLSDYYLDEASKGKFDLDLIEKLDQALIDKYFVLKKDHYLIKNEIRNTIIFANHNILKNPPFINIDLIVCRNMIMHLEKEMQLSLFKRFNYCLNKKGYLFLGLNEVVDNSNHNFSVISEKWKIYRNQSVIKELPQNTLYQLSTHRGHIAKKDELIKPITKPTINVDSGMKHYIGTLLKHYAPNFILVNNKLDVLHISGKTNDLFKFPRNKAEFNLENMVSRKNIGSFNAGIQRVNEDNKPVKFTKVPFQQEKKTNLVDLKFIPLWFEDLEEKLFIIEIGKAIKTKEVESESYDKEEFYKQHTRSLEIKLKETEQQLADYIEQYDQTNEELQTSNEELMSSNEEMQSTNEELQAVNQELYSVNSELQSKLVELTDVNNDINNLLSSTEIGTIFLDGKLKIRKYTPVIERLFNIRKSDIGRHVYNFTDNFNFESYRSSLENVLATKNSEEFEIKNKSNDKYYLMKINPFITDKGDLKGIVISFIDIDESIKVKEEINHWFDLSVDLISITDKSGTLKQYNPRFGELLGRSKEYIVQKSIVNFIHPDDRKKTKKQLNKLAQKPSTLHFENRLLVGDGTKKVISWSCQSTEDGTIYSIGRDITLDKQNYERLRKSHEELEQFAYVATHDLRAPIVNLGSLIKIFETLGFVNKENEELFGKLKQAVMGIHETLHDLIGIVALRKTIDQSIKKNYFQDILSAVIESIEEQVKLADAEIQTNFDAAKSIQYIPGHVKSVLLNLLTNAIKYRSPSRKLSIQIKTGVEEEYIFLTVKDNGKGIKKSKHHNVFKLFKRFDESVEGKGIGLFAIKSQIESNGGMVSFESNYDEGSTFKILFKPMQEMIEEVVS